MGERISKSAKAFVIIWLLAISFAFLYYYRIGSGLYRYPGMFVASVDMFFHGYVPLNVISRIPLFSTTELGASIFGSDFARLAVQNASQYPALVAMYLVIIEIAGLSSRAVMALGVGIFFVPAIVFITARRFFPAPIDALFASYFTIYMLTLPVSYRSYASFITVPALFLLLYFTHRHFNSPRKRYLAPLALLIVLHPQVWHTATIQVGALLTSIALMAIGATYLSRHSERVSGQYPVSTLAFLILFVGVITATFVAIWDSLYVAAVLSSGPPIDSFISNIAGLFGEGGGEPIPYEWDYRDTSVGSIYFTAHMVIHAISALLMTIPTAWLMVNVVRGHHLSEQQTRALIYLLGAGLAQLVFSILYSRTALGLAFVADVFIIVGIYGLLSLDIDVRIQRGGAAAALAACLILSVVMVGAISVTDNLGRDPATSYESVEMSADWTEEHTNGLIMTDFNLHGKLLSNTVESGGELYELQPIDPRHYAMAVGDEPVSEEYAGAYYVVDQASRDDGRPVHAYTGRVLMEPYPDRIDDNGNLDRVYVDGSVTTYRFQDTIEGNKTSDNESGFENETETVAASA